MYPPRPCVICLQPSMPALHRTQRMVLQYEYVFLWISSTDGIPLLSGSYYLRPAHSTWNRSRMVPILLLDLLGEILTWSWISGQSPSQKAYVCRSRQSHSCLCWFASCVFSCRLVEKRWSWHCVFNAVLAHCQKEAQEKWGSSLPLEPLLPESWLPSLTFSLCIVWQWLCTCWRWNLSVIILLETYWTVVTCAASILFLLCFLCHSLDDLLMDTLSEFSLLSPARF